MSQIIKTKRLFFLFLLFLTAALSVVTQGVSYAKGDSLPIVAPSPDCSDQESGIAIILSIAYFYVINSEYEEPTLVVVVSDGELEALKHGLACRAGKVRAGGSLVQIDGTKLRMRLTLDRYGRLISGFMLPSGQPVFVTTDRGTKVFPTGSTTPSTAD